MKILSHTFHQQIALVLFMSFSVFSQQIQAQPLKTFQGSSDVFYKGGNFSSNFKLLLYARDKVSIWNTQTGQLISEYQVPPNTSGITKAVLSLNGDVAAVGGFMASLVKLLDPVTGEVIQDFHFEDLFDTPRYRDLDPFQKQSQNLFITPDSKYMIAYTVGNPMWDLETGERTLSPFGGSLMKIFLNQTKFMTWGINFTRIYTFPDGKLLQEFPASYGLPTIVNNGRSIRFAKLISFIGEEPREYQISERDVETGEIIREFEPFQVEGRRSRIFKFSPNGEVLINVEENDPNQVFVHDGKRDQFLAQLNRQTNKPITASVFSPDSKQLAVVRENDVAIWDISDLTSAAPGAGAFDN